MSLMCQRRPSYHVPLVAAPRSRALSAAARAPSDRPRAVAVENARVRSTVRPCRTCTASSLERRASTASSSTRGRSDRRKHAKPAHDAHGARGMRGGQSVRSQGQAVPTSSRPVVGEGPRKTGTVRADLTEPRADERRRGIKLEASDVPRQAGLDIDVQGESSRMVALSSSGPSSAAPRGRWRARGALAREIRHDHRRLHPFSARSPDAPVEMAGGEGRELRASAEPGKHELKR